MPLRENLPRTASQVANIGEKKLYSDSAARNTSVILEVLSQYLPEKGKVLELASGTVSTAHTSLRLFIILNGNQVILIQSV